MNIVSKIFIPVAGVLAIGGGYFVYKNANPTPVAVTTVSSTPTVQPTATASPTADTPDTITQDILNQGTEEQQGITSDPTPAPSDEQAAVGVDSTTEQSLQVAPSL